MIGSFGGALVVDFPELRTSQDDDREEVAHLADLHDGAWLWELMLLGRPRRERRP